MDSSEPDFPPPGFPSRPSSSNAATSAGQNPAIPGGRGTGLAVRGAAATTDKGRGRGRGRRGGRTGGGASTQSILSVAPGHVRKGSMFALESLLQELQQRAYLVAAQLNPDVDGELGLPDMLQQYHTLYPLEDMAAAGEQPSPALGVRSTVLKGISSTDGKAYALRRIDGRQVGGGPGASLSHLAKCHRATHISYS
jgi:hypothetical protein